MTSQLGLFWASLLLRSNALPTWDSYFIKLASVPNRLKLTCYVTNTFLYLIVTFSVSLHPIKVRRCCWANKRASGQLICFCYLSHLQPCQTVSKMEGLVKTENRVHVDLSSSIFWLFYQILGYNIHGVAEGWSVVYTPYNFWPKGFEKSFGTALLQHFWAW